MTTPLSIYIVNYATRPTVAPALPAIVAALGKQLARDVQPLWGRVLPTLHLQKTTPPAGASTLAIFDDADQAGALGYHDETPQGLPYGKVFSETILQNGGTVKESENSISVTLSHELLEIVGDPSCNWWADNIDGYSYAMELADAVEGDAYLIDNVYMSNFVTPAFFDPHAPRGTQLDYLRKLSRPFTMTRGGYQIRRQANGQVTNIFGSEHPAWKRAIKEHPAARTIRRMQKPHMFHAEIGAQHGQEASPTPATPQPVQETKETP
jgi:hypothetical protein